MAFFKLLKNYFTTVASNSTFSVSFNATTCSRVTACFIPCFAMKSWNKSKHFVVNSSDEVE